MPAACSVIEIPSGATSIAAAVRSSLGQEHDWPEHPEPFTRLTFGAEKYDDGSSQQPERFQQAAQGHASAKFSHGWPAAGRMSAFSGVR
jgi:hypothetical protein